MSHHLRIAYLALQLTFTLPLHILEGTILSSFTEVVLEPVCHSSYASSAVASHQQFQLALDTRYEQ